MTPEQRADLERVMHGPVELRVWADTVREPDVLAPAVADCDAVAAVLPPELLGRLLAMAAGKPVLRALSGREPTGRVLTLADGRREREFAFVHRGWEQILRAEFQTRKL
ncbi:MAG: hypothetical protein IJ617_02880 [Oscillospiraceae bacterium]|nr:hypothetical protein [Oscillospiraceae bacterium]